MSLYSRAYWLCPALVVSAAFVLLSGCCFMRFCEEADQETHPVQVCDMMVQCGPSSGDSIAPGQSGSVTVAIRGNNLTNPIAVTADGDGVAVASWTFANGEVQTNLTVANDAALGAHSISTLFGSNGSPTNIDSTTVYVSCPGCVPTPRLRSVNLTDGGRFIRQGETKVVRLLGSEFLNRSPVLQFHPEESGLSLPANTTITVQRQNTTDYFDVPIVVAPDAPSGLHRVRVITAGGRTTWKNLAIYNPPPAPPPGSVPVINSISPTHITKGVPTIIKVEGVGFGTFSSVANSAGDPSWSASTNSGLAANPDRVVTAEVFCNTAGTQHVVVRNLLTSAVSARFILFVDEQAPNAPIIIGNQNGTGTGVVRGSSNDLEVYGQNLAGATNASWQGSPGLTFSNTQTLNTGNISFHVTAEANAPLTADEATNITLTTPTGQTPPFRLRVLP